MAMDSSVKKDIDLTQIEQICKEHQGRKGDLLVVLQKVQALCGYVPQPPSYRSSRSASEPPPVKSTEF